jgi:hypothetical protein
MLYTVGPEDERMDKARYEGDNSHSLLFTDALLMLADTCPGFGAVIQSCGDVDPSRRMDASTALGILRSAASALAPAVRRHYILFPPRDMRARIRSTDNTLNFAPTCANVPFYCLRCCVYAQWDQHLFFVLPCAAAWRRWCCRRADQSCRRSRSRGRAREGAEVSMPERAHGHSQVLCGRLLVVSFMTLQH